MDRQERINKGRERALQMFEDRQRPEHLRNLQVAMIQQKKPRRGYPYYLTQACISAIMIAATVWVIKALLF